MKNRDYTSLLIPLAAALAIYFPATAGWQNNAPANDAAAQSDATTAARSKPNPPNSPDETEKTGPSGTSVRTDRESNAAALLYDFMGVDRDGCTSCGAPVNCSDPGVPSGEYLLEFLIATLPDPHESRLSYLFDRNLEAVQRAIELGGYVFDRHDFPWKKNPGGTGAAPPRKPGVILFRSKSLDIATRCPSADPIQQRIEEAGRKYGRLLVLFVVGETPTSGVNKPMLRNALDQIGLLSRWPARGQGPLQLWSCLPFPEHDQCQSPITDRCGDQTVKNPSGREVRLMGPTFSGSEDSLELALANWLDAYFEKEEDRPIFSVISGSATSISQCRFCTRLRTPGQPLFHSTNLPSQPVVEAFRNYLLELDPRAAGGKIAILREANTAYGQTSSLQQAERNRGLQTRSKAEEQLPSEAFEILMKGISEPPPPQCPDPKLITNLDDWVLELPFPLHVSQLRTASEKAKSSGANRSGLNFDFSGLRRPLLPLFMDDGEESNDIVPLFSKLQIASLEREFSKLLDDIARERVRYAGIIATDVKDSIFLVTELRKHCPDMAIFVFFADVLYLRPEVNVDLRGTFIVTPYPLFGPNQFWSYPNGGDRTRFQFPTHITEGAYNATLALLGLSNYMQEYGDPFEDPKDKYPTRKPPLWVSIVGRDAFMPVKLLTYQDLFQTGEDRYPLLLEKSDAQPPRPVLNLAGGLNSKTATVIVLLLIVLGLIMPTATLAQLLVTKWSSLPDRFAPIRQLVGSWLGEMFGDPVFVEYKLKRRFYLLLCCASLLAIYLPAIWVFMLPLWVEYKLPHLKTIGDGSFQLVRVLLGLVMLLSLISAVWLWGSVADWLVLLFRQQMRKRIANPLRRLSGRETVAVSDEERPRMHSVSLPAVVAWFVGLSVLFALGYVFLARRSASMHVFFFVRATDLASGVSPLLPTLIIGLAGFLCAFCALRRWSLVERLHPVKHWELKLKREELPETQSFLNFEAEAGDEAGAKATASFRGIGEMERRVTRLLRCSSLELPAWPVIVLLVVVPSIYVLFLRFLPTVEGFGFDWLFRIAFLLVSIALALAFLRFICIWLSLRGLLRRLSCHPVFAGADQDKFAALPKIKITSPAPNYTSLSLSANHAIRLWQSLGAAERQPLDAPVRAIETNLAELHEAKAASNWQRATQKRCEMQVRFAALARTVAERLEPGWSVSQREPGAEAGGMQEGEVFLAGRVLAFLHYVLAHLQNLAIFVTSGMLLLLLAITSYPFHPRDLLLLFGWLLILSVASVTLLTFAQMDRDKVLSILSGGVAGQVTWNRDFLWRVLIHGLIPILALLSAQFPDVIQQLFSWLSVLQGGG
jgi:hypothetical protein